MSKKKENLKTLIIFALVSLFVLLYWQINGGSGSSYHLSEAMAPSVPEFLNTFQMESNAACTVTDKMDNKYGLPEQECRDIIAKYSGECKEKVANEYQDVVEVDTIKKMLLIGNSFSTCVFRR